MASKIVPFAFEDALVRAFQGENKTLWFVAKDVCAVLDIDSSNISRGGYLDEDEKGMYNIQTPGGSQDMLTVSESGLYSLIFRSRKPEAKRFRKWVTAEVLPAIRKTGAYAPQAISPEERARLEWLPDSIKSTAIRTIAYCVKTYPDRAPELSRTLLDACLCFALAPGDEPAPVVEFWRAYAQLEQAGLVPNHSQNPEHIAVNLPEFITLANDGGFALDRAELLRLLPMSRKYPFLASNKATNSGRTGKPVKCWIFRRADN